jgi:hypothetical protein
MKCRDERCKCKKLHGRDVKPAKNMGIIEYHTDHWVKPYKKILSNQQPPEIPKYMKTTGLVMDLRTKEIYREPVIRVSDSSRIITNVLRRWQRMSEHTVNINYTEIPDIEQLKKFLKMYTDDIRKSLELRRRSRERV